MMAFSKITAAIVLFGFCAIAEAHFHSVEPETYDGRRACDRCSTACPPLGDSSDSPVATWQRGETVSNVYTRNNHHGGFMRWSLVPIEHMYDEEWHSRNAFMHGCWEAGIEDCGSEDCGSDKKGKRFRRTFAVPAVYPDGIYVFASVWYGGTRFQRDFSLFPDYNTCAIVEIKGGADVVESYTAKFVPGESSRDSVPDGTCLAASNRVRQCDGEPCNVKADFMVPSKFADGKSPVPILSSDMGFSSSATPPTADEVAVGSDDTIEEAVEDPVVEEPSAVDPTLEEPTAVEPSSGEQNAEPLVEDVTVDTPVAADPSVEAPSLPDTHEGICLSVVCCKSSCGTCGGSGCNRREGGGENCCFGTIKASGRICSAEIGAPCVRMR